VRYSDSSLKCRTRDGNSPCIRYSHRTSSNRFMRYFCTGYAMWAISPVGVPYRAGAVSWMRRQYSHVFCSSSATLSRKCLLTKASHLVRDMRLSPAAAGMFASVRYSHAMTPLLRSRAGLMSFPSTTRCERHPPSQSSSLDIDIGVRLRLDLDRRVGE